MVIRVAGLLAVLLLLPACTRTEWTKSGAPEASRDADTGACRKAAGQDGIITVYADTYALADAETRFQDCMKVHGYAQRTN